MGYDLNRHWNQVSPWSHPTLHTIKNVLIDLDASKVKFSTFLENICIDERRSMDINLFF